MFRRAPIAVAVLLSVVLHVVGAIYWDINPDEADEPPSRTMEIVLQKPEPAEPLEEDDNEPEPLPEPAPPATAPPIARPEPPAVVTAAPTQEARDEREAANEVVLTASAISDTYQTADEPPLTCTPIDKETVVHQCAYEPDLALADDALLPDFFGDRRAADAFESDMDRVQQLARQADQLRALDPTDPLEAALIAEQRAEIRREVMRIDETYKQANLLRVFPMGFKALRALREKLASKN